MAKAKLQDWFKAGLAHHQRGELEQAADLYGRILAKRADHVEANSLLGALEVQTGHAKQALVHLKKALAGNPNHPVVHANLGLAYHELGDQRRAIDHYRQALALNADLVQAANNLGCLLREQSDCLNAENVFAEIIRRHPDYAPAHHNLGLVRKQMGDIAGAIRCYRQAVSLDPAYADALYNLGNALREQENYDEAVSVYARALELRPHFAEAICNLGVARSKQGQVKEAIGLYLSALALKKDYAEAYCNLGTAYQILGDHSKSLEYYRKATDLRPDYAEALSNMANAYQELHQYDAAVDAADRALALDPRLRGALINKGAALIKMERFDVAESLFRHVLTVYPDDADALINLGSLYTHRLQADEALACFERVLALDTNNALAHWNRAWILLSRGDLAEGWKEYTWGVHTRERNYLQRYPVPVWEGEDPAGKTLIVHGEQGVGDEVLFASCIPDLLARGARCIIQCDPRLVTLFKRSFPAAAVHGGARDEDPAWIESYRPIDFQVPIGNLAVHLRPRIEDFAGRGAYLVPDNAVRERWRGRLRELGPGLKVGIAWRSRLHAGLRAKYFPKLVQCEPLLTLPGAEFVNLQYDECADEIGEVKQRFGVTIHDFSDLDLFNDLDGSVALASALDLVIAPSTTTFNLAAGCGVPTWLFYPSVLDAWRLGAKNFPWFPNAVLFEQPRLGDWDTVVAAMAAALRERLAAGGVGSVLNSLVANLIKPSGVAVVTAPDDDVVLSALWVQVGAAGHIVVSDPSARCADRVSQLRHAGADNVVVVPRATALGAAGPDTRALEQCDLMWFAPRASLSEAIPAVRSLLEAHKPLLVLERVDGPTAKAMQDLLRDHGYAAMPLSNLVGGGVSALAHAWVAYPTATPSR